MSEKDPTEKEKREAEALARALEGDPQHDQTPEEIPQDALEAAGLLRASREDSELDPARARAGFEQVLADRPKEARRLPWLRWLVPIGAVAGALFLVMTFPMYSKAPQEATVGFPSPSRSLLEVQAKATQGREELKALEEKMRAYRNRMYSSLSGKYPG